MLDIAKNILSVIKSLLGLSDKLRQAKDERKKLLASLLRDISECLSTVSASIRAGQTPHGKCSELLTYAQRLPKTIADEVGQAEADRLGKKLLSAHSVEDLARIGSAQDKDNALQQLDEAAGSFAALAKLLPATGS